MKPQFEYRPWSQLVAAKGTISTRTHKREKMAKTSMVVMIVALMMLISGIAAKTLNVGGDEEWSFPSSDDFYTSWAAEQEFIFGDILVFKFDPDMHTVAIVTSEDAYVNCKTEADDMVITESPYKRTLNSSGQFYFFCTKGSHCANGLKFPANVLNATGALEPSPNTP